MALDCLMGLAPLGFTRRGRVVPMRMPTPRVVVSADCGQVVACGQLFAMWATAITSLSALRTL